MLNQLRAGSGEQCVHASQDYTPALPHLPYPPAPPPHPPPPPAALPPLPNQEALVTSTLVTGMTHSCQGTHRTVRLGSLNNAVGNSA